MTNIELPGVSKENLDINVEGNYVVIKAKSRHDVEFRKRFFISRDIDRDSIRAELKDGLLSIFYDLKSSVSRKIEVS